MSSAIVEGLSSRKSSRKLHRKLTSSPSQHVAIASSMSMKIGRNSRAVYNNLKKITIFIVLFLGNVVKKRSRNFLRAVSEL
jgi:hypothetical protein